MQKKKNKDFYLNWVAQNFSITSDKASKLPKEFLEYDTGYRTENGVCYYPLFKGKGIIITIFTKDDGMHLENLWTTIRRWTPQKEKYYKSIIGEEVDIET